MHSAHIVVGSDAQSKRIQSCAEHSRAAAELAKARLEACGLGEAGYLAGLLHDCGKYTDEFDAYLEKAVHGEAVKRGSVIHTFAGVCYLLERFRSSDSGTYYSNFAAEALAVSIGSHHGFMDLWDEYHQNGFEHRLKRQPEYDRRAIADFHAECASAEEIESLFQSAVEQIESFVQEKVSRSIDRNDIKEIEFAQGLLVRLITSALVDADRTDTRCFMQGLPHPEPLQAKWEACAERVNAHVTAFPNATPIQMARGVFSDHCAWAAERKPGLYRLDLPTGGGKTLAALRFAVLHARKNGMRRIIYTAPLLSIIDQNAKEIRKAVGDTASVLEHHSNLVRDKMSDEEMAQTELLQETWDTQIIITTFVQLLNTLFSGKMSCVRRFHCLSESVIIIDEVQSLPNKLLSMFNIAVNFLVHCCGATVLLCSATQPPLQQAKHRLQLVKPEMLDYERLISKDLFQQYAPLFKRTSIRDGGHCSLSELVDRAALLLEDSDSLLIVCNTKREAADLVEKLGALEGVKRFHLSAGMCMAHRERTLEDLNLALARKEKLVCVSTQLIEAGVDVSFGAVIRLSAGLDNIVQCAGRCNRHGEHAQPQPVEIYHLNEEKLGSLREIQAAQAALNVLLAEYRRDAARYGDDLASERAIEDYYAALYRQMEEGAQDYTIHGQTLFELLSTNSQFMSDEGTPYYLNQAFKTAGRWFEVFDAANESVIVPYGKGAELIEKLNRPQARYDMAYATELLQKAKPYAVSLPANQIDRMAKRGMIYTLLDGGIYILNAEYYDDRLGVKEGNDLCSTLIL